MDAVLSLSCLCVVAVLCQTADVLVGNHRIIEYAELEGTFKDHQIQLLALHRTIPKSHTMCLRALSTY